MVLKQWNPLKKKTEDVEHVKTKVAALHAKCSKEKPFGQRNPWRFGAPRRNSTPWQTKNINPELRTLKASISWLVRDFVSALFQKKNKKPFSPCRLRPCAKPLIQNSTFCLTSPALFSTPPFQADDFLRCPDGKIPEDLTTTYTPDN